MANRYVRKTATEAALIKAASEFVRVRGENSISVVHAYDVLKKAVEENNKRNWEELEDGHGSVPKGNRSTTQVATDIPRQKTSG